MTTIIRGLIAFGITLLCIWEAWHSEGATIPLWLLLGFYVLECETWTLRYEAIKLKLDRLWLK